PRLAQAQRGLSLGLRGDVLAGREQPSAPGGRAAHGISAVAANQGRSVQARADAWPDIGDDLFGRLSRLVPGVDAPLQDVAGRQARMDALGRQAELFGVTPVDERDPAVRVVHAHALVHALDGVTVLRKLGLDGFEFGGRIGVLFHLPSHLGYEGPHIAEWGYSWRRRP